jgi:hypothetical protein
MKDDTKITLKEISCEDMEWINPYPAKMEYKVSS